ncbi:MAG: glutamate--tRNA ligase [Chloroflexota bacterium]|nr:glutamate--tRNA ligase [Chloroflexota bacterium]
MNESETRGPVRVRFAPSPTGIPHVGNIRTALFNWLFARHCGGSFVLRIEDTDVTRKVEGAVEAILDSLRWLGLDWDEGPEVGGAYGPYFQSERLELYHDAARRLIEGDNAYCCYCSAERLDEMRKEQMRRKQPPGYDRRCRNLSDAERAGFEARGITPVVRFKMPLEGQIVFQDLIRGEVAFDAATLDDFVLLKSDGYPTYHLANVVDDHLMKITHVMRADEWLSSTPRHVLLYGAFGYELPQYAHLPMILGPDRGKLSKRHGATSLMEYAGEGYLPEAMLNFLALLGWSLDDKTTIISRDDLLGSFSLERIGKTGAVFDREKLAWMNGVYIRELSVDEMVKRSLPFLEDGLPQTVTRPISRDYLRQVVPLLQERVKVLSELPALSEFFFVDDLDYDRRSLLAKGMDRDTAVVALQTSRDLLQDCPFDAASLEGLLRPLAADLGMKTGALFGLLRVAVTGRTAAPPLFETMAVLGRDRCLKRIESAVAALMEADV